MKIVDLILFRSHTESMSSMFDKLGDMLNECLEKGEIPQPPPKRRFYKGPEHFSDSPSSTAEQVHEQEPIALPHDIEEAFILLGLVPTEENAETTSLPPLDRIRSAYAQLLKEAHPDTAREEITSAQAAQKINQLTRAFNRVREWYRELGIAE